MLFQIALLLSIFGKHFHYYLPHPFSGVQVKLTGLTPHILFFAFLEESRYILYSLPQENLPFAIILFQKWSTVASQTHWPAPLALVCIPIDTMEVYMFNVFINLIFLYWGESSYSSENLSIKNYLKSQNMGPGLCLEILIKSFTSRKEHSLYVLQFSDFYPGILTSILTSAYERTKKRSQCASLFCAWILELKAFCLQSSISLCSRYSSCTEMSSKEVYVCSPGLSCRGSFGK